MIDVFVFCFYVDLMLVDYDGFYVELVFVLVLVLVVWEQVLVWLWLVGVCMLWFCVVKENWCGYFVVYWYGEQSLVCSYWVNNIFVVVLLVFVFGLLMMWISVKGDFLQVSVIVLLVGVLLLMLLDVWCIVGGWCLVVNYLCEGGLGLWGWFVCILFVLGVV